MVRLDSETGILMVGHGSRAPEGNAPLLGLCRDMMKHLENAPLEPCYLELARPTIEEGLEALHRRGVRRAIVVPLQLTAGRHVRFDIPGEVESALQRLPGMSVCFTDHLGSHSGLREIADSRLAEAMNGREDGACRTHYLLVARGSRGPLVRGEVLQCAGDRGPDAYGNRFSPCFLVVTRPNFEEGLRDAVHRKPERIVVQPHLLFPGRLLHQVRRRIGEMKEQYSAIEWIVAAALGPDERLAQCAADLVAEAISAELPRSFRVSW